MIVNKKVGGGTSDSVSLVKYLIDPSRSHSDSTHEGERVLLIESSHLLPPSLLLSPEAAGEKYSADLEVWQDQKRRGRGEPTHRFTHTMLSFAHEDSEKVDAAKALEIAKKAIEEVMGADRPVLYVVHGDTKHMHIHCHISNVDSHGKIWQSPIVDGKRVADYRLWELAAERAEIKHGLFRVDNRIACAVEDSGRLPLVAAPKAGELKLMLKTGEQSPRIAAQEAIQKVFDKEPKTVKDFCRLCDQAGIGVLFNVASTGRISGVSYAVDGVSFKGSDLGKGFSFSGLNKRGISYEHTRDGEAVAYANEQTARREFGITGELGGNRPSHGHDGRGVPADQGRTEGFNGGEVWKLSEKTRAKAQLERRAGESRTAGMVPDRELSAKRGDALVVVSEALAAPKHIELKLQKLRSFVSAVCSGAKNIVITLVNEVKEEPVLKREYTPEQLFSPETVGFLSQQNLAGKAVFMRPTSAFVVDDLSHEKAQSCAKKYNARAVVETSPGNYQVWLPLASKDLAVNDAVSKAVMIEFGADKASAQTLHAGRVPAFNNKKSKYDNPFVRLDLCSPDALPSPDLVALAQKCALELKPVAKPVVKPVVQAHVVSELTDSFYNMIYMQTHNKIMNKSDADFSVAMQFLKKGNTAEELKALMVAGAYRKGGRAADYCDRTIAAAQKRLQQEQEQGNKKGKGYDYGNNKDDLNGPP